MTIALDATYSCGNEPSGVGLYSHEVLLGLARAHPETRFQFCYRPQRLLRGLRTAVPPNVRKCILHEPLGPRRAALFHGLNQRLPRIPLRRAVTTFHDLFVLTGEYSTAEFRERFTAQAREAAARSDFIIAVSAFTKCQVISLLGVPENKVQVVHHGIRTLKFPDLPREKIVLSVGAIQKRKNTARMVEAFEALDSSWRLVLAGSAGYGSAEILERIGHSKARKRISVLGYVSPSDLARWYARASIFAFPSLDEGFGMPVLEAMAAGVPVLTSSRSSLPEIAGEAALLVDPGNAEEMADGLRRLSEDLELRLDLARLGLARARLFTWEQAVRETWRVYESLLR